MKFNRPLYSLSAFRTPERGPITPADFDTETARTSATSERGIMANELMLSFFPAFIMAVIDRTSETTNALLQVSMTAVQAFLYCAGREIS